MRMPRMQVYLPEDLYRFVKDRGLPASELLQRAVQAELRRQGLLEETDRYLQDLVAEVGAPNADAMAKADALSRRVRRTRTDRRAS
jgi:post-segregation antitoxin (ccd killing protein)